MVRPAPAGAHPPLHDPAPARRDRAGRRARFPPLPVRLAACRRGDAPGGAGRASADPGSLEGFEAPAKAWETEILPARLKGYRAVLARRAMPRRPDRLGAPDAAGRRERPGALATVAGARDADRAARAPPARRSGRRSRRQTAPLRRARAPRPCSTASRARRPVLRRTRRRPRACCAPQVEEALGELVALGLVTSDSFAGLRALLVPSGQRKPLAGAKRRGRVLAFGIESGGRWALVRRAQPQSGGDEVARRRRSSMWRDAAAPLRRRVLAAAWRGGGWLPPWRDLLARLPPARGARRDPRRPLRRRLLRRAIRPARGGRPAARDPPPAGVGRMGVAVRRRSAQSRRHPDAGPAGSRR